MITFNEARRVVESLGFELVPKPIYDEMRERCAEQDANPSRSPRLPRDYTDLSPAVEALQSGRGSVR